MKIRQIRDMLNRREISVPELTKDFLRRIGEKDPPLNSYITVPAKEAEAQAYVVQQKIDRQTAGMLAGIPISVKDNICTKGIRTTCGSRMLAEFVPGYDATVVKRIPDAVLLGKTNMDEFGMGSSGQNSFFGSIHNPYHINYVPGGSSGGGAAAVAAGLCQAALCSDTGGSVRQPAAFCGVTGLKPTYGLVSRFGLVAFASSLDQIGVIAGSAEDCGAVLAAIAGRDEKDMTTWNKPKINPLEKLGQSIKGLKIGIPAEFYSDAVEPVVKKAVLEAARFYEQQGCRLIQTAMPSLTYAVPAYYLVSSAEAASNLSRFDGVRYGYGSEKGDDFQRRIKHTRQKGFGWEVKRRIMLGNYALSSGFYEGYYQNAVRVCAQIKREFTEQFETCDMLLTPTAPITAYPIGERPPLRMYMDDFCTVPVNLAGLPAVSTVCGYSENGMPIGMSLIGRAFSEAMLIGAADLFERNFTRREAGLCSLPR